MSDKLVLRLFEPVEAWRLLKDHAWPYAKNLLMAGHRLVLEIREETRSDAQNRLLHSRISDIARQCEWAGRKWSVDEWKRLLTAAWCRTRNEGVQLVPALDGQGVDVIYQRTSELSRRDCADLSEYIMAWGTGEDVQWSAASIGEEVSA